MPALLANKAIAKFERTNPRLDSLERSDRGNRFGRLFHRSERGTVQHLMALSFSWGAINLAESRLTVTIHSPIRLPDLFLQSRFHYAGASAQTTFRN